MELLGIFAKYWQPGRVKTRLAASIGADAASQIYFQFLKSAVRRFENLADRRSIHYWPAERRDAFHSLAGARWELAVQRDGDLGQRMEHFFEQSFATGAERVVLIGSDSPSLPYAYLRKAFQLLQRHPVVLGPSDDGGYYLVGASNTVPPLFDDVEWSTETVWKQTVVKLRRAGITYAELPTWYDVDDETALRTLLKDLAEPPTDDPALHDLLVAVEALMPNE